MVVGSAVRALIAQVRCPIDPSEEHGIFPRGQLPAHLSSAHKDHRAPASPISALPRHVQTLGTATPVSSPIMRRLNPFGSSKISVPHLEGRVWEACFMLSYTEVFGADQADGVEWTCRCGCENAGSQKMCVVVEICNQA